MLMIATTKGAGDSWWCVSMDFDAYHCFLSKDLKGSVVGGQIPREPNALRLRNIP